MRDWDKTIDELRKNIEDARKRWVLPYLDPTQFVVKTSENKLERLENHYVQVKEYKETIVFLRSIAKGIGNRSYGIYVGKMAGLPSAVIDRANDILNSYMVKSYEKKIKVTNEMEKVLIKDFDLTKSIIKEIDLIDINNTTPLQALEILIKLKKINGL